MAANVSAELERFHVFIAEKIANGGSRLSPEDVLDEWRLLNPTAEELAEGVAALQHAIADMEAGDKGISFEEFDRQFRASQNLPPKL